MRRALTLAALVLIAPAAAQASGGGLTAGFGGEGATRPADPHTYVTIATGRTSVLQAINKNTGAIDRYRRLPGLFGAPQVTYDGVKTGLSLDGKTLVLSDVPHVWPIRRTRLLVLDAPRLKILQRIDLKGFYSVDALSPNGQLLFLVHYLRTPGAYEVVAYDRADGTQRVIMDPDEPGEQMSGTPMSRVTSADGGYEYTLYDRPGEPFIHALDTQAGTAECIDLPQLAGRDLSRVKLRLAGDRIAIGRLATLDPATQRVIGPGAPKPRATAAPRRRENSVPWPLIGVGLAALGAIAFAGLRRRPADDVVDLHVTVDHADEHPAARR